MRSRLRKLHVEEHEFAWTADVRAAPGADGKRHRCVRVRVWGGGKTGRALQADLAQRPGTAATYPYPEAADVRTLVEHGLRTGWDPAARGGTFQVTSAAAVALPGFVLIDALWASEQHAT